MADHCTPSCSLLASNYQVCVATSSVSVPIRTPTWPSTMRRDSHSAEGCARLCIHLPARAPYVRSFPNDPANKSDEHQSCRDHVFASHAGTRLLLGTAGRTVRAEGVLGYFLDSG